MTAEEFKAHFKKENNANDKAAYFSCVLMISVGAYFLWTAFLETSLALAIVVMFYFSFCIYTIWRIGQQYEIKEIKSDASLKHKVETLKAFSDTLRQRRFSIENEFYIIRSSNRFFMEMNYYVVIDNDKILIHASGPSNNNGDVLDFGDSRRAMKKIHKYFLEHL